MFFFNQKYLTQYNLSSSVSARKASPGSAYIEKYYFFETHYKIGELFMEFIKFACEEDEKKDERECDSCVTWTGLPAKRVPQPVPDTERLFHYMHVADTPSCTEAGEPRPADDWQPRANITKLFQDGKISLQQQDEITTFSETFYVERKYVVACLEHLTIWNPQNKFEQDHEQKKKIKEKKKSTRSTTGLIWYYKENLTN